MDETVAEILSSAIGAPVDLARSPYRLGGGFWAQIWAVDLTGAPHPFDQPLVLRVMPDRIASLRETVVQKTIADTGFRTPRAHASGVTPGHGEAYIVMQRITGQTPLGGLRLGPELLKLPALLRRLPTMLATTANTLHAIDPDILRTAFVDAGIDQPTAGHPFRPGLDRAVRDCPTAGFGEFVRWLDDNKPEPRPEVICHGDLHPLNVVIDDHDATWLLDWTTATVAPKEMDIGLTAGLLRCAPIAVPRPLSPIVAWLTNRLAEAFINEVAANAAIDRAAVNWWEALQHGRCLAELAHGRLHADGVVGPGHPFETSVDAMRHRLRQLTGITITPPVRV